VGVAIAVSGHPRRGSTSPDKTKVCGRFFTDGSQRGGAPCNRILR
jgi:hypothetical protein